MQNAVTVTLTGNITTDIEVNYTKSKPATPVANFNVATTPRYFDSKKSEWVDGETIFTRCVLWNQPAENAGETYHKGDRVILTGAMVAKPWVTEDGEERVNYELQVTDIGPSTMFATAVVTRNAKKDEEKPAAKTAVKKSRAGKR